MLDETLGIPRAQLSRPPERSAAFLPSRWHRSLLPLVPSSSDEACGTAQGADVKARAAQAARAGVERGTLPLLPQVSTHMPKRMNSKIIKQRSALVNPLPGSRLARPEPGKVKQSQDRTLVLVKGRGKYEGG